MPTWTFAAVNADHAAQGLSFHVEAMAFRGASLADMLAVAARATVITVDSDDAPVSGVQPTARPGQKNVAA